MKSPEKRNIECLEEEVWSKRYDRWVSSKINERILSTAEPREKSEEQEQLLPEFLDAANFSK